MLTKFVRPMLVAAVATIGATAVSAQDVTVVTDRGLSSLTPIIAAFQRETGYTVSIRSQERNLVDALLDLELDDPADVMITTSVTNLDDAFRAGLTIPVQSELLETMVPAELQHPQDHWFAVTRRTRGFYVSNRAPRWMTELTYEDLASERLRGRICIRSGTHAYNIALFAAYAAHHGREEAEEWMVGLRDNLARVPTGNDRAQMRAVAEGTCRLAVANSYYYGLARTNYEQREWAEELQIIFPKFEDGGTHINISGMAMLDTVDNVEAAQAFMEFQLSEAAQEIYARHNFEFAINDNVEVSTYLESWGEFDGDPVSLQAISDFQTGVRATVEEIAFNDGPQD